EQVQAGGGGLRAGDLGEVSLSGPRWVTRVAGLSERGYLLFIDYGEPADLLYGARHPRGTLRCYLLQTMNEQPYLRVGAQDLTAHVDLTSVARVGRGSGLDVLGVTSQSRLLDRLGIARLREAI